MSGGGAASARALVVNDWVRKRYRRRAHQKRLQTWHGTMLKKLGARPNVGVRTRIAVKRERDRWDALLAQNPYSAETSARPTRWSAPSGRRGPA